MPRPGPRPYECVKRAWHSDRHHPVRGSLIQEIFRVVNEVHSSATKKNKEWQEKLPIVVLKAEEIMYSKANSEAEYVDPKTLWSRLNDAINTIIRREESTETGELLQPCIEAALNLGCTPRRESRSTRNGNPRCYLTAINPVANLDKMSQGNNRTNSQCLPHNSNFVNSTTVNTIQMASESHCPRATAKSPDCVNQSMPMETCHSSSPHSVYCLYYGNHPQSQESESGAFGVSSLTNSHCHTLKPTEMEVVQNPPLSTTPNALEKIHEVEAWQSPESFPDIAFDLSLRLGPLLIPCSSVGNSTPQVVEDVGSSTSQKGNKLHSLSPPKEKALLFCKANDEDQLGSCSSKLSIENQNTNMETAMRKRKTLVNLPDEDMQSCGQPKLPHIHLRGRTSNSGL